MIIDKNAATLPAVLVTNVDTSLGNSIVRNISFTPIRHKVHLCGLIRGKEPFGGEHLCDSIMRTPSSYSTQDLATLCAPKNVGLIIPTTEKETVTLKEAQASLPFVLASSPEVSRIFLDKALTAEAFERAQAPFCPTFAPSQASKSRELMNKEIVLKPRRGEHSGGILFNPQSLTGFSDEHYVVQPLMKGQEITTAIYFTADGHYHGSISFIRRFVPQGSVYEVTWDYEEQIRSMARRLRATMEIIGSINIQSIVVNGALVPFEVNGRISSSNVIRSELGFPDVQWGIEEYLLHGKPSPPEIKHGSAITNRVAVIYPDTPLAQIDNKSPRIVR